MAKVMVINGVWASLICGMLACSAILYTAQPNEPAAYGYAQIEQLAQR